VLYQVTSSIASAETRERHPANHSWRRGPVRDLREGLLTNSRAGTWGNYGATCYFGAVRGRGAVSVGARATLESQLMS
jgi:hypothetical protein